MNKKLRNKILIGLAIFLLVASGLIIYLLIEVDKALNPDPKYNTVFTEMYNENNFNKIQPGDDVDYVIDIIGKPFKVDTIDFIEQLLYTNSPEDVFFIEGSDGLRLHGGNDSLKYSNITVNNKGEVIKVFADFELGGKSKDQLMLLNKNQLIELFGEPQKHMICDCKCAIYSYSKLKEGPYRGKLPVIDLRKIMVLDSIVVGKVKIEGNPYNSYIGTCKINKN
ncbi:hypothetical protein J1N10_15230 [Carboxylicivirga sp. A043]|uniref:hypothetical protein n=1 Tax=Carboxylicivirga litoralis TaxID=2816963 RepID=UPI0021CB088D|nr:hypothetical protein [Carboxylicivirga sp. A043]MCU4157328.1 hypothetical protein [Carboxylicivirga sp. A043]